MLTATDKCHPRAAAKRTLDRIETRLCQRFLRMLSDGKHSHSDPRITAVHRARKVIASLRVDAENLPQVFAGGWPGC